MIHHDLFSTHDVDAWRAEVATVDHSWWHTWEANQALSLTNGDRAYLLVISDQATGDKAILPYAERHYANTIDIYSGGFTGFASSGQVTALQHEWRRFAEERGYVCGYFPLHPITATAEDIGNSVVANELFLVKLDKDRNSLFAEFGQNVRRSIRSHEKKKLGFVTDREEILEFFHRYYSTFMISAGAKPTAVWTASALTAVFYSPSVFAVGVRDSEGICAASLFGVAPTVGEYITNISVREGRRWTAALIWSAIQQLQNSGVKWLNLGGGIEPGDNLAAAKRRYHPVVMPFRAIRQVYDPKMFSELNRAATTADLESRTSFFPPYRAAVPQAPATQHATTKRLDASNWLERP